MADRLEDVLPETLRTWVTERASGSDADGDDVGDILSRAVTLYRLVEEHAETTDGEMPPLDEVDDLEDLLEPLDERIRGVDQRVTGLDQRVATVEDDLDEKITDLRERVVQVKREADGKAPVDHDHPDLRERVDRTGETATRAAEGVEELESRVAQGFDNYEEVLEHLVDELETVDGKLTKLASAVVDLRRRTAATERTIETMNAVADLKTAASREGETKGKCGDCDTRVSIGLLTEPNCPHCGAGFVDVEPSNRFFGLATLLTEGPPALTAGSEPAEDRQDGVEANGSATTRENGSGNGAGDDDVPITVTELFSGTKHE
jgi:predicted  nucleic acid-binding Zn-ribbon protein